MSNQLRFEEFAALLNQVDVARPVGIDQVYFPLPLETAELQAVLAAGQAMLANREKDGVQALVQIISEATAVVQAILRKESAPDQNRWYFTNGSDIVRLQAEGEDGFLLDSVASKAEMLAEIEQFIPLEIMRESLNYRAKFDQEDFNALRDLATEWHEVPALEILEADGLDQIAARDLFDSAVEPEWRGIIECMTCQGQTVTDQFTIRALQGEEISWVIRPSTDGKLIAEAARQGRFQQALATIWN